MSYTIKVVIRLEKKSAVTSVAPICLRMTVDRNTTYKTIFKIKPEFWDDKKSTVRKSHPNASEFNALISKERNELEKSIILLGISDKKLTIDTIRRKINNPISTDFFEYSQKYIEKLYKDGNASLYKRYKTVISKFKRYHNTDKLPIGHITTKTIIQYEKYLSETAKNRNNTITANMKVISKLISDIYDEYRLDSYDNPFHNHKYKFDQTHPPHLEIDEILRIKSLKISPSNPLYDAKQVFLFECCTGLRISDILTLKWKNINDDKISMRMRKTDQNIVIPLFGMAKDIIYNKADVLLTDSDRINLEKYVFNILKTDIDFISPLEALNAISSATAILNRRLKKIAEQAKISTNLSTHVGRHSFATNLITKKVQIYTVKELLGHKDIRTTQIYAKVVDSTKVEAIKQLNL